MIRRWAALFEVIGILVVGWTLTRIALTLLPIPDLQVLLDDFSASDGSDFSQLSWVGLATLCVQYVCIFTPAYFIALFLSKLRPAEIGFGGSRVSIFASVKLGVILFCVAGIPMKLLLIAHNLADLGEAPSYWRIFDKEWNLSFWVFMGVGSYAVIPIFEEILHRGYAFGRLAREIGFGAVLVTSALFAAIHFQYLIPDVFNIWMLTSLFVLALAMGLARQASGSLIAPITMHVLMNVPVLYPYDYAVLGAMVVVVLAARKDVARLLGDFTSKLRGSNLLTTFGMITVVAGFALAMAQLPELALAVFASLFLVSIVTQVVLRLRAGKTAKAPDKDA